MRVAKELQTPLLIIVLLVGVALLGSLALGTINLKKSFNTHDSHLSPSYEPVVSDQPNVK